MEPTINQYILAHITQTKNITIHTHKQA
jgi:hypothetical protein